MNAKLAREMEEQAKQLGNAYLPGAQAALHSYTKLFAGDDGKFAEQSGASASGSTAKRSTSSAGCTRWSSRAGPTCSGGSTTRS